MRLRNLLGGLLALALFGCADQNYSLQSDGVFTPKPKDETSIEAKLSRYEGQTEFLNPHYSGGYRNDRLYSTAVDRVETKSRSVGAGPRREIQESDVFKLGPKGSKLLYLLNNYRGLQVVSFEDGANAPKIKGRVLPSGNSPQIMYDSPADDDQYIVVENHYQENNTSGRVLVYDINDASDPVELKSSSFQGRVVDSRLVGDILYVASVQYNHCLLYTSPSPRDKRQSRMPSSA